MSTQRCIMISYVPIETEGRFNRSVKALAELVELTVIMPDSRVMSSNLFKLINIKTKIKGNALRYIEFIIKFILAVFKMDNFDIVYAHNSFAALPSLILLFFGKAKKIIYDAYELRIPTDVFKFSFRDKFFYYFEKKVIKNAKCVIATNEIRSYIMVGHYGLKSIPIVIRNIVDIPFKKNNIVENKSIELGKNIKIIYAGAVSKNRMLELIIDAVKELGSGYHLQIAGDGPDIEYYKKYTQSNLIKNVCFTGKYNQDEIGSILEDAHIGYIAYPNYGWNNLFCSPNKLYDYAMFKIPMVAVKNPILNYYFYKYDIGESSGNIKDSIHKIVSNYDKYVNNVGKFRDNQTWENEKIKFKEVIKQVTK